MRPITKTVTLSICTLGLAAGSPLLAQSNADDRRAIISIIEAIERGWETADGTPFRQHYLDFEGARYIEGGGQNEGLTDLIEHHVEPEGDMLSDFELDLGNVEIHIERDFAWTIAGVESTATLRRDNRQIHNSGHETFVFRRIGSDWKIVPMHSSTRPVTED